MRITLDSRAAAELTSQNYLIEHHALRAAARLEARCDAFFEHFLAHHPRSGKPVAGKGIWETWIPGTRLVVWYRSAGDELQIIRIWHAPRTAAANSEPPPPTYRVTPSASPSSACAFPSGSSDPWPWRASLPALCETQGI
jgi:plasmid stabilization system protein ParE